MCRACQQSESPVPAKKPTKLVGQFGSILGWLLPSAALALVPKCPACVVAYVALLSGVGISVSTASFLRTSWIVLCLGLLLLVAAKGAHRLLIRILSRERIV